MRCLLRIYHRSSRLVSVSNKNLDPIRKRVKIQLPRQRDFEVPTKKKENKLLDNNSRKEIRNKREEKGLVGCIIVATHVDSVCI